MAEVDSLFEKEKTKQFIKELKESIEMKRYNKFLTNFDKVSDQYYNFVNIHTDLVNSTNKKNFGLNQIEKWFYGQKVKVLKVRRERARAKVRVAERQMYSKILLQFVGDSLKNKTLYSYEYEQWAEKFIELATIEINMLQGSDLENIKIITDLVRTLFLDVLRDDTFQKKHELEVINAENLIEKFIYETIKSEEILNFQTALINFKTINEQYQQLVNSHQLVMENIDLKIQKITEVLQKNDVKLEKLKKAWFFKNIRCKMIKKDNKKLEIKIQKYVENKEKFTKKIEEFRTKALDNSIIKKADLSLCSKLLTFFLQHKNVKQLTSSGYEMWKNEFIMTCEEVIKKLEFDDVKVKLLINFAKTLFNDVLRNIELQENHDIEVSINDNDSLCAQATTIKSPSYDSGISCWADEFSEITNINIINPNDGATKQVSSL